MTELGVVESERYFMRRCLKMEGVFIALANGKHLTEVLGFEMQRAFLISSTYGRNKNLFARTQSV